MSDVPRPDLSKILPVPWVRRLASPSLPFAASPTRRAARGDDYLVEVRHREAHDPAAAGFGIAQARAVATRLASVLRSDTHAPDPVRVERVLARHEH